MPAQYLFGWLPQRLEICDDEFQIRSAQRFEEAIANVQGAATYKWFYPPLVNYEGVQLPAGRLELPITHVLATAHRAYDRELGEFLVLVLGFVLGLRLTIQGTGHLTAVAVKPGTLVNFLPRPAELIAALTLASEFWDQTAAEERRLAFAAIHGYLAAQCYRHQYEEFAWQYMVLDNIHRLTWRRSTKYQRSFPNKRDVHSRRPAILSTEYGSPLPTSFADEKSPCGRLIHVRNELVHEARWLGAPIGYAADADAHDIICDLKHFNSQLILGTLGFECQFRASRYDRQIHALDMQQ